MGRRRELPRLLRLHGRRPGRQPRAEQGNEAYQDGNSGACRRSPFQDELGNGFVEEAFRTARTVDADAELRYNGYGTDGRNAKSNAVYARVKDFEQRGAPIGCVCSQSRFTSDSPAPSGFQAGMPRFADLGADVQITGPDTEGSGAGSVGLAGRSRRGGTGR